MEQKTDNQKRMDKILENMQKTGRLQLPEGKKMALSFSFDFDSSSVWMESFGKRSIPPGVSSVPWWACRGSWICWTGATSGPLSSFRVIPWTPIRKSAGKSQRGAMRSATTAMSTRTLRSAERTGNPGQNRHPSYRLPVTGF